MHARSENRYGKCPVLIEIGSGFGTNSNKIVNFCPKKCRNFHILKIGTSGFFSNTHTVQETL